jgi:hypothetical protein
MLRLRLAPPLLACVALCAALMSAPASPGAVELETSALALLRGQLEQTYNCDLAQILTLREVPVGDTVGIEGRARCADAREYDFSRSRAGQRFEIRLCQPTVC